MPKAKPPDNGVNTTQYLAPPTNTGLFGASDRPSELLPQQTTDWSAVAAQL